VIERGKIRNIQSVHILERVAQKSLCSNILKPLYTRSLIYDNGACLKGKGVDFALNRCAKHLRDHYRKHGTDGYVLLFDFRSYFPSIQHGPILAEYDRMFHDARLREFAGRFIDAFGDVGLGLGSEICQIHAVSYASPIDHLVKDQFGIHGYGRYMDDGYVISDSKERLSYILSCIKNSAAALGLMLNEKKTQIVKLSRGFRFMKTRFILTKGGRVLRLIWRRSLTKMRQKLKSFKRLVESGLMSFEQAYSSYQSWRGYAKRKDCFSVVQRMDLLFYTLFGGILHERTVCC